MLSEAMVTCPACGQVWQEKMPIDSCRIRTQCPGCKVILGPHSGDCCVYCSFADVDCPAQQMEASE